jgi:hypothetical protein
MFALAVIPGEVDAVPTTTEATPAASDPFPPELRRRFKEKLGLCLQTLRKLPTFRRLGRCAWATFVALAMHWQGREAKVFPRPRSSKPRAL